MRSSLEIIIIIFYSPSFSLSLFLTWISDHFVIFFIIILICTTLLSWTLSVIVVLLCEMCRTDQVKLYLKEQSESRQNRAPVGGTAGHHHHHHHPFGHHHQTAHAPAPQPGTYKELSSAIDEPNTLHIPVVTITTATTTPIHYSSQSPSQYYSTHLF